MKLSVVTSLYYSEPYIKEFYDRIKKCILEITDDYEIIFVNDGSPDNSLEMVLSLKLIDNKIKIIDLSRNFGHHNALRTGLKYAKGEYIYIVDCDLEESPEFLKFFWEELIKNPDTDLVYGIQQKRKGGFFESKIAGVYFNLFNFLSDYKIQKNIIMSRLMTRNFMLNFIKHEEYHFIFSGISALTGYKQVTVPIKKGHKKSTTYNLSRKISMLLNSITSFSAKPLIYISYLGFIILFISAFFVLVTIYRALFYNSEIGWPSTFVSIWFLGGLTIFCIGIVGIYISKIFEQVKNRPFTIIKKIYD